MGSRGRSPSLRGALVNPGEAGFERSEAGGLALKGGQQFPVVGVQFLQQGKVVGVQALAGGQRLREEVRPADRLGLGWFGAEESLREQEARADCADDRRPALACDGAGEGIGDWRFGIMGSET